VKGTDTLCADYIEGMMSDFTCTPFTGVLSWKACNNNERVIHVQKSSSNRAFSTNNKIKGRFEKDKEELNDNIAAKTCYQPETKEKEINPCQPNTIQINLLGRQFNTEIPTHRFRDKECHSFTFLSLPIIDPNAETSSVPSVMDSNVPSMTLSNEPSVKASNNPSATASFTPSVVDSNIPSETPSLSPISKFATNSTPYPVIFRSALQWATENGYDCDNDAKLQAAQISFNLDCVLISLIKIDNHKVYICVFSAKCLMSTLYGCTEP
jgi:hypothetical protein